MQDTVTITGLAEQWENWERTGTSLPLHLTMQCEGHTYTAAIRERNGRAERTVTDEDGTTIDQPEVYDDDQIAIMDSIMLAVAATAQRLKPA